MRPQLEIERDTRIVLQNVPEVWGMSHLVLHYDSVKRGVLAEASIIVDPELKVSEVSKIAKKAQIAMERDVPDIVRADIHLELSDFFDLALIDEEYRRENVPYRLRLDYFSEADEKGQKAKTWRDEGTHPTPPPDTFQ